MQTFLPYPSFDLSASALDRQRLGKQRVETLQLLKALNGETKGWSNHPAAKMWRGHELALVYYGVTMCEEWIKRGYKDTCTDKILAYKTDEEFRLPSWFGDMRLHKSHQSNLLRKDFEYYSQYFDVSPDLPYYWPVV